MVNFFKEPDSRFARLNTVADIDLREEMDILLLEDENAAGQTFVIRRMRRDSNGSLIYSPSMDPLTRHGSEDVNDKISYGERFLFDDYYIYAFKMPFRRKVDKEDQTEVGIFHQHRYFLFVPYNQLNRHTASVLDILDRHDRIVEPMLDLEGKILSPMSSKYLFNISHAEPKRLKGGRIEFYRLVIQAETNFRNT